MSIHLHRQVDRIKQHILDVGAMVERGVERAVRSIEESDLELAETVINDDRRIDLREVEEECLSILALHQPMANDLRFVVAVLKMNYDLERIGDLAVNMASQAAALSKGPAVDFQQMRLSTMAEKAMSMLKWSLDALIELDADLAERVRRADDEVDEMHRQVYELAENAISTAPYEAGQRIRLLIVARQLERIADHAVDIARDVLYMIRGEIVRHSREREKLGQQSVRRRRLPVTPRRSTHRPQVTDRRFDILDLLGT